MNQLFVENFKWLDTKFCGLLSNDKKKICEYICKCSNIDFNRNFNIFANKILNLQKQLKYQLYNIKYTFQTNKLKKIWQVSALTIKS